MTDYLLRLDGQDLDLAEVTSTEPLEIDDYIRVEKGAVYQIRHLVPPDPGQRLWVARLFRVWDGVPPSPLGTARTPKVVRVTGEAEEA